MSSGTEVPHWRFSMIHIYLQWQELAWDSKSSSMRFGYSYFTGHEVFNLWFVKHMQHKCIRINFSHSRCLWWGQWELKAGKYHNFWRFIKLAITASLRERPFFYFYVESPPSTFMNRLREHSCHSEHNVHCPKVFIDWFILLVTWICPLGTRGLVYQVWPIKEVDRHKDSKIDLKTKKGKSNLYSTRTLVKL
jgi:hypothetical protein